MFVIEMQSFFTTILMLAAYGLPQTCLYYCKQLTHQFKNLRQECNCTTFNQPPLSSDPSVSHETLQLDLLQKIKAKSIRLSDQAANFNIRAGIVKRETFGPTASNLKIFHKSDEYYIPRSKPIVGYPIYLDIGLHTSLTKPGTGTNFKEELKHIFKKVRASENHVSECTDLHIYIFSKNNDNINKTHTNWGHRVKHGNLTDSEVLTEILNKCDQPTTIIRESVYEIKKREHVKSADNNSIYDEEKYRTIRDDLSSISSTHDLKSIGTDFEADNVLEIVKISTGFTDNRKIDRSGTENRTGYVSIPKDQNTEIYFNKTKLMTNAILRKPIGYKGFRRNEHMEKDLLIPKIITKEHANNTITSIVDGFETIPNLDFVSNVFSKTENAISSVEDHAPHVDQSNLVQDTKGNLHISFDNNPIPARFILNSEGEMHLAIDGFSLCDRMTQNLQEKPVFLKLLCDCIQFHNCSH